MSKVEFLYIKDFCEYYEISRHDFNNCIKPIEQKLRPKKPREKFMPFEVTIIKNWIEKGEK